MQNKIFASYTLSVIIFYMKKILLYTRQVSSLNTFKRFGGKNFYPRIYNIYLYTFTSSNIFKSIDTYILHIQPQEYYIAVMQKCILIFFVLRRFSSHSLYNIIISLCFILKTPYN